MIRTGPGQTPPSPSGREVTEDRHREPESEGVTAGGPSRLPRDTPVGTVPYHWDGVFVFTSRSGTF